jgi:hypothetical protein
VLLLAPMLVSPHLTVYDLVILAPAFLLLADWARGRSDVSRLGSLLYASYILPLAGPLARWTHAQVSVIAMALLMWLICRMETSSAKVTR